MSNTLAHASRLRFTDRPTRRTNRLPSSPTQTSAQLGGPPETMLAAQARGCQTGLNRVQTAISGGGTVLRRRSRTTA